MDAMWNKPITIITRTTTTTMRIFGTLTRHPDGAGSPCKNRDGIVASFRFVSLMMMLARK